MLYISFYKIGRLDGQWTCKKCTLVNDPSSIACAVCGGSKLRRICSIEDMTLRKGEFWTCSKCTLKNNLSTGVCIACKSVRSLPIEPKRLQLNEVDTEGEFILPNIVFCRKIIKKNNFTTCINICKFSFNSSKLN